MDKIIALGAFLPGFGISSTICATASYPVVPKVACKSPSIHAR